MNDILLPNNKGVPISRYPKIKYEQSFLCASDGCGEISRFFIDILLIPNNTSLIQMNGYVWHCGKCGLLQEAVFDLPKSTSQGEMQSVSMQGGNGDQKKPPAKKRKRKPKKKKDEDE